MGLDIADTIKSLFFSSIETNEHEDTTITFATTTKYRGFAIDPVPATEVDYFDTDLFYDYPGRFATTSTPLGAIEDSMSLGWIIKCPMDIVVSLTPHGRIKVEKQEPNVNEELVALSDIDLSSISDHSEVHIFTVNTGWYLAGASGQSVLVQKPPNLLSKFDVISGIVDLDQYIVQLKINVIVNKSDLESGDIEITKGTPLAHLLVFDRDGIVSEANTNMIGVDEIDDFTKIHRKETTHIKNGYKKMAKQKKPDFGMKDK